MGRHPLDRDLEPLQLLLRASWARRRRRRRRNSLKTRRLCRPAGKIGGVTRTMITSSGCFRIHAHRLGTTQSMITSSTRKASQVTQLRTIATSSSVPPGFDS
jgi:hypothetical protein